MKWFQNLKTASKINFLISIMIAFLIAVGITGYYYTKQANIRMESIYKDRLLALKYLDNIIIGMRANEANLLTLMQLNKKSDKLKYINKINIQNQEILQNQEKYKKTKLDPIEVEYFNIYIKNYKYYINIKNQVIKFVSEGKSNEIKKYYISKVYILDKLTNILENLSNYNDKIANNIYHNYEKAAQRAYIIIIALILLSLLLLIPLSLFISYLISHPLVELNKKMNQVIEGNLDIEPAKVKSSDEPGMLSNSFNLMTKSLIDLINKEKKSAERDKLLNTINNEILTTNDINKAYLRIAEQLTKIFNVDRTALSLYDPVLNKFSNLIGEYKKNENIPSVIPKGYPFTGDLQQVLNEELVKKKQILVIENPDDPKYSEEFRNHLIGLSAKSTVWVPIIYQNNLIAVIFLTNTEFSKKWSKEEINLLSLVAGQIAIGINLFKFADESNKSLNTEISLREIITIIRQSENHDQLFTYLLKSISKIFNVDRALHLHYCGSDDILVINEIITHASLKPLKNKIKLNSKNTKELASHEINKTIIINDVNK